jgi:hypothetical protein
MILLLLVVHILIGLTLVVAFLIRFAAILAQRITGKDGRGLMLGLTTALVGTGVALVVVAHSPLTSACLSSLAIIATVAALEGALQLVGRRLSA